MILKNEIPILEFDTDKTQVINPTHENLDIKLPKKAVFAFLDEHIERYAKENSLPFELFEADWKRYGKSAGPKRNEQMVQVADYVIAFWDFHSRGTKSLIEFTKQYNKPLRIKDIRKF